MIEGVLRTIEYVEANLHEKLCLENVADAVAYSKYHLHRSFADLVGLSIHGYIQRRQLTEAARLLVRTGLPIQEIALSAGYESQQSFSKVFKAMYKQTPQQFRLSGIYYPLQLRLALDSHAVLLGRSGQSASTGPATQEDVAGWMELVRLTVDGFPLLQEEEYRETLARYIRAKRALIMKDRGIVTGVLLYTGGAIDFFAVHPFYRRQRAAKELLDIVAGENPPATPLSTTTYRQGDKADTGYRAFLLDLGFREAEMLVEFGYPTQRFVLPARETA